MKLAILIGISEYSDTRNNLPGCKKDINFMKELLQKTNNYDEVEVIDDKVSSARLKEKFASFISDHKEDKIEEFFFYYTGHGEFFYDEFYFQLSDYNSSKRKQTSLQNQEVDTLIKTLQPELVVKVIDACQSGKNYIKENDVIDKYFNRTSDRFKKCYFLNSSMSDQSSYQNDNISDFTYSFINAIKQHESKEIRYKDIIDFISDEFEHNTEQTPLFVIQADLTEKFCRLNSEIKEFLKGLNIDESALDPKSNLSIVEKVKRDAKNFSTKEEAFELLEKVKSRIEALKLSEELDDLYDLNKNFYAHYDNVYKKNVIGQWLDDKDHDYFASAAHKTVKKDKYKNGMFSIQSNLLGAYDPADYEVIRDGFTVDIDLPYKTVELDIISRLPNIDSFSCRIIYFLSKKQIIFFYFITDYEEINWEDIELNTDVNWLFSEHKIHDQENVFKGIEVIFQKLESTVKKYLEEKFSTT